MDPTETTRATPPRDISLLSPVIDINYYISGIKMSATTDRMTTNKKSFTEDRKFPKNDHEDKVSYPKKTDSHEK